METVIHADHDVQTETQTLVDSENTNGSEVVSDSDRGNGVTDEGAEVDNTEVNGEGTSVDTVIEESQNSAEKGEDMDSESLLRELEEISGKRYGSLSEFPEYRRYLELRKSGLLSAEEAFYAVNRNNTCRKERADMEASDTKGHLSPSRGKRSSGEVFTRADREELAKWGISATGERLERLWREAGRG